MSRNHYVSGQFNVICDVCGKKIKSGKSRHRWDGFVVCEDDWEERQPQDFVRARQDKISVPFTRPRPVDSFRLLHTIQDMVQISDQDHFDDYMFYDVSNMYFLEDYMLDQLAFTIQVNSNQHFNDTLPLTESCEHRTTKPFTDQTIITDSVSIGSVYRSTDTDQVTLTDTDQVTLTDTGNIFQTTYVDRTYFSEQYVGTFYNF